LSREGLNRGHTSPERTAGALLGSRGSSAWQAAQRIRSCLPRTSTPTASPADLASSTHRPLRSTRINSASLGIPIDPDAAVGVLVGHPTITSLCLHSLIRSVARTPAASGVPTAADPLADQLSTKTKKSRSTSRLWPGIQELPEHLCPMPEVQTKRRPVQRRFRTREIDSPTNGVYGREMLKQRGRRTSVLKPVRVYERKLI
jgi:hypothetical protein